LREDIPLLGRWIARAFQQYWRVARGYLVSVEACVIDEAGNALMVRNENGANWNLPGGRVRQGEDFETALRRTLAEIAGIDVNDDPELIFFYAVGEREQRGVYLVRNWRQSQLRAAGEMRFSSLESLPAGVDPEVSARIRRLVEGRTIPQV
jgi:ADP-ribose pyrophosphatase YjhB (NUDIX family)